MGKDKNQVAEMVNVRSALDIYLNGNSSRTEELVEMIRELQQKMVTQVVHFVFRKVDGTTRHAYGTRSADVIANYGTGSDRTDGAKAAKTPNFGTFPYFDIERKAWRCFRLDRLVSIEDDYEL